MRIHRDLRPGVLNGVLWRHPRGAIAGALTSAALAAGISCAAGVAGATPVLALALGWTGAYGGAIVEESVRSPGRALPALAHAGALLRYAGIRVRHELRARFARPRGLGREASKWLSTNAAAVR
jgi:hypothetical protein